MPIYSFHIEKDAIEKIRKEFKMETSQLKLFSAKVEQLLAHCKQLESDNATLKTQQSEWAGERMKLLQKNDLAKNKIESMIGRLKSLEQR